MSIVNSRIQNLRAKTNIDKNENRGSTYGALDLFVLETQSETSILTPELKEKSMASVGSTLETPVIDYDAGVTISNSRVVTIADDESTTQMVSFPFTIYSWGFTMIPDNYHNNEIGYAKDWNTKFIKYWNKFLATLDTACVTKLEALKTLVFADPLVYTITGNTVAATLAQQDRVLGDTTGLMGANDFYDQLHVVGNYGIDSIIRQIKKSDLYNSENKRMEWSDKIVHTTSRLSNAANKIGTAYVVNAGNLGMLFRLERPALYRTKSRTGHEWDHFNIGGFPMGSYYYHSVGDQSASAGAASADHTRGLKEHFGFSVDVSLVGAYNSDTATIASPVLKLDVADA